MYISDHPDFSCQRSLIWPNRSICMQGPFICHAFRAKPHNQKCTGFIFAFTRCSFKSSLLFPCKDVSHLIAMKWKWLVFISHDWCFWSLMLFKVFLTSAFLLYIFSASVKLKTKPSSCFILYIFTLNSLKLFISFKSFWQ